MEGAPSVPMLADTVDAVIGVDTHRDTHHAEIAHPSGAVIATCSVPNTSSGYTRLLGWARPPAPPPPETPPPGGAVIATCPAPNPSSVYTRLLGWARQHAPGPRLAACIE